MWLPILDLSRLGEVNTGKAVVTAFAPDENRSTAAEPFIADLTLHRVALQNNMTFLNRNDRLYVPFRKVCKALGFRLHVDDARRLASGFLRSPSEWLVLEGNRGLAKTRTAKVRIGEDDSLTWDNSYYLSAEKFQGLTRVKFSFDSSNLTVSVETTNPLNLTQQEIVRRIPVSTTSIDMAGPIAQTPYLLATIPSVDLEMDANVSAGAKTGASTVEVSGAGYGDLLYFGAQYQVVEDSTGSPQLLLELGRSDSDNKLLGPIQASQYKFGSIYLPECPLLVGNRSGLGVSVDDYPLDGGFSPTTSRVAGPAPEGSEVELYRADELIAAQKVGENKRYDFPDVSLEQGPNQFRIVTLLPNDDVHIEKQTIYGLRTGAPVGKLRYRLSADRPESSLTGTELKVLAYSNRSEAVAQTQYGVSPGAWVDANLAEVDDVAGNHTVAGLGIESWQAGALWNLGLSATDSDALSLDIGSSVGLGNGTLHLDAIHSLGRSLESDTPLGLATASGVRLSWDGHGGSFDRRFEYGGGFQDAAETGYSKSLLAHFGMETRSSGFYTDNVYPLSGRAPNGLTEFHAPWKGFNARADFAYDFSSSTILRSGLFSLSKAIAPQYVASANCAVSPSVRGALSLGGTVYRLMGPLAAGLNCSVSEDGLKLGLLFSTAASANNNGRLGFAKPGLAEMGRVRVRTFLDKDGSGKFHPGNPALPNVSVRVVGRGEGEKTGADGVCEIQNLSPNERLPVALDEDSLSDPSWIAEAKSITVIPRAGRETLIDIPVSPTAEIDGEVQGKLEGYGSWIASLQSAGKPTELTSSVDDKGGYLFSRVMPGAYVLSVRDSGQVLCRRAVIVHPGVFNSGFNLSRNSDKP